MINDTITAEFWPIVGVVVGALLHYMFSMKSMSMESQMKLKTEAYVDFVRGVAGIAISQQKSAKNMELNYTILLTDAKARIAIYGSKEVIKQTAVFFNGKAKLNNPESINSFINVIQAMRRDSLPSDQSVPDEEINSLLFSGEDSKNIFV